MKTRAPSRIALRPPQGTAPDALAELALSASDVLDLASGVNPMGPPKRLSDAARDADIRRYPHPTGLAARSGVAERFSTSADQVVLGAGAAELLWSCARVLVEATSTVLAIEPGYPEFTVAARQLGARVVQWRSVERTGHRVELQQVVELMRLGLPRVVCLGAPGYITGASLRLAELARVAQAFPDTHFVVDQSFLALSDDRDDLMLLPTANMICVRSLSKEFGVPGVRAAYLLADAKLAARIEATRPAYSTSAQTQAVVQAAMDESTFSADSAAQLRHARQCLAALLDSLELTYTPSVAPYLLVRLARASEVANDLLARHRIAVCDATPFGLPDHIRIAAISSQQAAPLSAALCEIIQRRGLTHGREA
jgi:histidinol-phosphate/aromatic aminotransferase/cobyric acid decarboxylase-like protein